MFFCWWLLKPYIKYSNINWWLFSLHFLQLQYFLTFAVIQIYFSSVSRNLCSARECCQYLGIFVIVTESESWSPRSINNMPVTNCVWTCQNVTSTFNRYSLVIHINFQFLEVLNRDSSILDSIDSMMNIYPDSLVDTYKNAE